jgi:tRNA pseudouridine55 synthase
MVRLNGKMSSGVLVIDKPRGPTSHDVVARVRRAVGTKAVGHAGTLDPMATGVLVLALGEATKLVPWLTAEDKTYEAAITLGVETDTLDADGREVRRAPVSEELRAALAAAQAAAPVGPLLEAALEAERARTSQVPPAFSALKTAGQRSYVRARRGEPTLLAARDVQVRRLELVECSAQPPVLFVRLDVGKGYYVRALARDLATALGTAGHLSGLRRTRSGSFTCREALALEAPAEALRAGIHSLSHAATRTLPVANLTEAGALDARLGRFLRSCDIDARHRGPSAWLDPHGELVAVGEVDEMGRGKVLRGFASAASTEGTPLS